MLRRDIFRLIIFLLFFSGILALKACSSSYILINPSNTSPAIQYITIEASLRSKIYYINGLATLKADAERNLDRIIAAVGANEESVLDRLKENVGFEQNRTSYQLAYNKLLSGPTGTNADPTYQIIASFALKIKESAPALSDDQVWQIAYGFLKNEDGAKVVRDALGKVVNTALDAAIGTLLVLLSP